MVKTDRQAGDAWAGYRFSPRLISSGTDVVWVMDTLLPVLVRIDRASGRAVSTRIAPPERIATQADALLAADRVWVRWREGLTCYDPSTAQGRFIPAVGHGLAVRGDTAWTICRDGRLARVEQDGLELTPVGPPERLRPFVEATRDWVWTVSWDETAQNSALLRVDPADGSVHAHWELRGRALALIRDTTSVWVALTRIGTDGFHHFLACYASATDGPVAEIEIPVSPVNPVMTHGVLSTTAPLHGPSPPGYPTLISRVDATSGAGLSETDLSSSIKATAGDPAGVIALLDNNDGRATIAILSPTGEITTRLRTAEIDLGPHPPPATPAT